MRVMSDKMSVMSDAPPRLNSTEVRILQQLAERPKYGLELVNDSDGELKRSVVYVILSRMKTKGLVASRNIPTPDGESGPPRREYRVTALGQRALAAHEIWAAAFRGAR